MDRGSTELDALNVSDSRLNQYTDTGTSGLNILDAASYVSESECEADVSGDTTLKFDVVRQDSAQDSSFFSVNEESFGHTTNLDIFGSVSKSKFSFFNQCERSFGHVTSLEDIFGSDDGNEMDTTPHREAELLSDENCESFGHTTNSDIFGSVSKSKFSFFNQSERSFGHVTSLEDIFGSDDGNEMDTTPHREAELLSDENCDSSFSNISNHNSISFEFLDQGCVDSGFFTNPSSLEHAFNDDTYYEMGLDQTKVILTHKKFKCLSNEKDVEKILKDPDSSSDFHKLFEYLRWKITDAGVVPHVMLIGEKEKETKNNTSEGVNENVTINVHDESVLSSHSETVADEKLDETHVSILSDNNGFTGVTTPPLINNQHSELNNYSSPILLPSVSPSPSITGQESFVTPKLSSSYFTFSALEENTGSITLKIEREIKRLVESLINHEPLIIRIKRRKNWDNCVLSPQNTIFMKSGEEAQYHQINFDTQGSKFYFTLFIYLLEKIYSLLVTKTTCTKRELYYRDPDLTKSQRNVDMALDDISCLLDEPLWKLGVLSSSKGLVAGDLVIVMKDNTRIDCQNGREATVVPADICGILEIKSDAQFILIVEKDTVFKKLLDDNIFAKLGTNIILITGKGYPDVNTRHLVKRLIDTLNIPAHILVDADPHGIEIMFTYKFGSLSLAHLEELASPTINWIGIRPTHIPDYKIPMLRLTDEDDKKLDDLLQRPYITDGLRAEIIRMKTDKKKAEIESLHTLSATYLLDEYLPSMIRASLLDD